MSQISRLNVLFFVAIVLWYAGPARAGDKESSNTISGYLQNPPNYPPASPTPYPQAQTVQIQVFSDSGCMNPISGTAPNQGGGAKPSYFTITISSGYANQTVYVQFTRTNCAVGTQSVSSQPVSLDANGSNINAKWPSTSPYTVPACGARFGLMDFSPNMTVTASCDCRPRLFGRRCRR
jgi:hypothetical protein